MGTKQNISMDDKHISHAHTNTHKLNMTLCCHYGITVRFFAYSHGFQDPVGQYMHMIYLNLSEGAIFTPKLLMIIVTFE